MVGHHEDHTDSLRDVEGPVPLLHAFSFILPSDLRPNRFHIYYTRRVTADDLRRFKGSAKTCLELIINVGSMRADKKAED